MTHRAVPTVALTASPASEALETELLFGKVEGARKIDGHARVILETDGYEGWVKADMTSRRRRRPRIGCVARPSTFLRRPT